MNNRHPQGSGRPRSRRRYAPIRRFCRSSRPGVLGDGGCDATDGALAPLVNGLIVRIYPGNALTAPDATQAAEQLAVLLAKGPRRLLILDDVDR
jgi:hypothetical protein